MSEVNWRWVPDSAVAGDSVPCASTASRTCTRVVNSSGTMLLSAYVNGEQQQQSLHVDVVPCPTGDSLLDTPEVRRLEQALWDSSNVTDPNQSNRVERIGAVIDSAGQRRYVMFGLTGNPSLDTPCAVSAGSPLDGRSTAGWTITAIFHTHPFADSTTYTDNRCPGGGNGTVGYAPSPLNGWASGFDWNMSASAHAPSYIIDFSRITRILGDSGAVTPLKDASGTVVPDEYVALNGPAFTTVIPRNPACSPFRIASVASGEEMRLAGVMPAATFSPTSLLSFVAKHDGAEIVTLSFLQQSTR